MAWLVSILQFERERDSVDALRHHRVGPIARVVVLLTQCSCVVVRPYMSPSSALNVSLSKCLTIVVLQFRENEGEWRRELHESATFSTWARDSTMLMSSICTYGFWICYRRFIVLHAFGGGMAENSDDSQRIGAMPRI